MYGRNPLPISQNIFMQRKPKSFISSKTTKIIETDSLEEPKEKVTHC